MNLFFKKIILFVFASLLIGSCLAQRKKVRKEIRQLMEKYEAVGLGVAVVKNGRLAFTESFGWKDLDQREKLHKDDIFRIASISKSFSATAIQQLAEAGKLSLDDDISQLVGFSVRNPAFPNDVITLRMLLSHTSSINDSQGYFSLDSINPTKTPNWTRCYNNYRPGQQYQYCNLNFNMIGAVIERTSGERFDVYIRRHILDPLQLYGGYCIDSLDASRFATIHEYNASEKKFTAAPNAYHPRREELAGYVRGYSTPVFSPTGGMKISAPDLARYMIMHMNLGAANGVRIIQEESARQMQKPVLESAQYGLALMTTAEFISGQKLIGHTGSAYGLHSVMLFSPDEKWGMVLICNGSKAGYNNGFQELLKKAGEILYRRLIDR
jgi:CubicO group peptidase (beta-lactamase class C family)